MRTVITHKKSVQTVSWSILLRDGVADDQAMLRGSVRGSVRVVMCMTTELPPLLIVIGFQHGFSAPLECDDHDIMNAGFRLRDRNQFFIGITIRTRVVQ